MARGYPGILYPVPILPHSSSDIERRSREHVRRYLRHRLRSIDAQIQRVSRDTETLRGELRWTPNQVEAIWDRIVELDHLESVREAISDALTSL